MSTTVRKVYELHDTSFGTNLFFNFICIGFLAEDSKVDGAVRPFQIFSDDQLIILYKDSQNILNLFPMTFLKMKGSGAMTVYFPLKKTCKSNTSAKNSERRDIRCVYQTCKESKSQARRKYKHHGMRSYQVII